MLTHLHIKNFKAWKDTGPIRLAPLTVIFGANSAGKSSLGCATPDRVFLGLIEEVIGRIADHLEGAGRGCGRAARITIHFPYEVTMTTFPSSPLARTSRRFVLALAAAPLLIGSAFAQAWPSQTIKIVVPFPPGGPTDTATRIVGQKLAERLKQLLADGKLVAVHSHGWNEGGDAAARRGFAVVDIFRVEGCRVMEHWDVLSPVPENAANTNTMF